jgi:hypothetical protein
MFLPLSCRNTQECADIKERRSIPEDRKLPFKLGSVSVSNDILFKTVSSHPVSGFADVWK